MNAASRLAGSILSFALLMPTAAVKADAAPDVPEEGAAPSALWQAFENDTYADDVPKLPDFSYAGYARGETGPPTDLEGPLFDVTDFGATPDDMTDDREAIQRTIDAATKAGGGVVYFPAGRYLVNSSMADRGEIYVASNNIVLRGAGAGRGGTVIHSIHPFGGDDPHNVTRLHLRQNVFVVEPEAGRIAFDRVLCNVIRNAPRGSVSVEVDDAGALSPGQWLYLHTRSSAHFEDAIAPYEIEEAWTQIRKGTARGVEIVQVEAISDNVVTFKQPLFHDINADHEWTLQAYEPIENVGIEDICFMGNAFHAFFHHRSGFDDTGWPFIKLKGVANAWVQRCTFINASQTIMVAMSSNVSLLNLRVDGNTGHHLPRVAWYASNVLGGFIVDNAGYQHGLNVAGGSVGTVYWRCWTDSPIDLHAGHPYATLIDATSVQGIASSGGERSYPQHLRNLVLWNVNDMTDEQQDYHFWKPGEVNRFVKPIIAGYHGSPVSIAQESVEYLESLGTPVSPDSLYEAQLHARLGTTPSWIHRAAADAELMSDLEMPNYFNKDAPPTSAWDGILYYETFSVHDMLEHLTSLSLQMFNSRQFTFSMADETLEMHSDQSFIRASLYELMHYIYRNATKMDNRIEVTTYEQDGLSFTSFAVITGKPATAPEAHRIRHARTFAEAVGGRIEVDDTGETLVFTLHVPATLTQ